MERGISEANFILASNIIYARKVFNQNVSSAKKLPIKNSLGVKIVFSFVRNL